MFEFFSFKISAALLNKASKQYNVNMTIKTVLAAYEDVEAMANLLAELFNQEVEFVPHREKQVSALNEILENPAVGTLIVAKQDNVCVGMILVLYTVSTALGGRVGILEDMIVSPEKRGAGIGKLLIEAALAQAKSNGCKRITLLTDTDNYSAHRFYEQAGFTRSNMVPFRIDLA